MSEEEAKVVAETAPKAEEEEEAEADEAPKEEESTANFEPVVSSSHCVAWNHGVESLPTRMDCYSESLSYLTLDLSFSFSTPIDHRQVKLEEVEVRSGEEEEVRGAVRCAVLSYDRLKLMQEDHL